MKRVSWLSLLCMALAFNACKDPNHSSKTVLDVPHEKTTVSEKEALAKPAEANPIEALLRQCDTCFDNSGDICTADNFGISEKDYKCLADGVCSDGQNLVQLFRNASTLKDFLTKNAQLIHKYDVRLDKYKSCLNSYIKYEGMKEPEEFCGGFALNAISAIMNNVNIEKAHLHWTEQNPSDATHEMWHLIEELNNHNSGDDVLNKIIELIKAGADINSANWDGNYALFVVQNKDLTKALIQNGADPKVKDINRNTLLHRYADDSAMIDFLTEKGLDVNAKNNDGISPIFLAQNVDILKKFIQYKADIKATDLHGNTVLHRAVDAEMLDLILAAGVDVNAKNDEGKTPVFYIKDTGESGVELLKKYIEKGADIKIIDSKGNSLLHHAPLSKDWVEYLRKAGLDVNLRNADGRTPIFGCIHENADRNAAMPYPVMPDKDCIQALRAASADIHAADNQGNTIFSELFKRGYYKFDGLIDSKKDYAPMLPHVMARVKADSKATEESFWDNPLNPAAETAKAEFDALELLIPKFIDAGLNVSERDEYNNTYLFYISSFAAATALIKAGLDVNLKNNKGETALNHATVYRRLGAFQAMLDSGADVHTKDNAGQLPLFKHLDIIEGFDHRLDNHHSFAVPEMLLQNGADVNARDDNGRTLLFYEYNAESDHSSHDDILNILIALDIDFNVQDKDGRTALMVSQDCDLLKAGADPSIKDNDGRNAAFYNIYCFFDNDVLNDAAKKYDIKTLVNTADKKGVTPIMNADLTEIKYYIDAGADVNAKDASGKRVLDYHAGNAEALALLKAAGAK